MDPKRIVADGYDRMGREFSVWNSERPPEVRRWFLEEVLARLPGGSAVLELGCGPGRDAAELSAGRRYIGVDLSPVQLSIARRRAPHATFVVGDFTSLAFRPGSFDGVVAFYRSEEHTSELQSRRDLVCRLLLEKKKKLTQIPIASTITEAVMKHDALN